MLGAIVADGEVGDVVLGVVVFLPTAWPQSPPLVQPCMMESPTKRRSM